MSWRLNSTKPIDRIIPGSLCYLVSDDHILLMQRRNPPHVGLWSPPGGKMNPCESPLDCVRREYLEETGLTLLQPELRAVTTVLHAGMGMHWLLFIYLAREYSGELTVSNEGDLQWIALREIDQHPRPAADVEMLGHVLRDDPIREMQFGYDEANELIDLIRDAE
jgi:8-oxo-dGTP diphosphatase